MKPLHVVAGGVVLVALAFAAGRWTAPAKVVERSTDSSWMDARSVRVQAAAAEQRTVTVRRVVTVRERQPTGELRTVRTEDTATGVDLHLHATDTGAAEIHQVEAETAERIVERERPSLAVEATAVVGLRLPVQLDGWQVQGQARLLGPLWFGAGYGRIDGAGRMLVSTRMEF